MPRSSAARSTPSCGRERVARERSGGRTRGATLVEQLAEPDQHAVILPARAPRRLRGGVRHRRCQARRHSRGRLCASGRRRAESARRRPPPTTANPSRSVTHEVMPPFTTTQPGRGVTAPAIRAQPGADPLPGFEGLGARGTGARRGDDRQRALAQCGGRRRRRASDLLRRLGRGQRLDVDLDERAGMLCDELCELRGRRRNVGAADDECALGPGRSHEPGGSRTGEDAGERRCAAHERRRPARPAPADSRVRSARDRLRCRRPARAPLERAAASSSCSGDASSAGPPARSSSRCSSRPAVARRSPFVRSSAQASTRASV